MDLLEDVNNTKTKGLAYNAIALGYDSVRGRKHDKKDATHAWRLLASLMRRCSRLRASLSACASSSPSNSSICSSSVGSWPWPRRLRFRGGEGPPSGSGVGGCFPPRRCGTLPGRGLGARVTAFLALLRGMLRCESKTSRDCPVTLSSNGVPRVAEGCRANQKPHIDWPKYILALLLQNMSRLLC